MSKRSFNVVLPSLGVRAERQGVAIGRFASDLLLLLCAPAALSACADPEPPVPPYGAEMILAARDPELQIERFDRSRSALYYSRTQQKYSFWDPGRSSRLFELYRIDLGSRATELVAQNVLWFSLLPSDGPRGKYVMLRQESEDQHSRSLFTIVDDDAPSRLEIHGVVGSSIGWATSEQTIVFVRDTPSSTGELWAGPYASPSKRSGDLNVHDWAWLGKGQVAIAAEGPLLVNHPIGIHRIDLATSAISEEAPAHIDTADWLGTDPAPPLASDGLAARFGRESRVVAALSGSCWSTSQANAWGAPDQLCYLLYERRMSDDSGRCFLYLPDTKRETALPSETCIFPSFPVGDGRSVAEGGNAPMAAWSDRGLDGTRSFWVYRQETRTLASCKASPGGMYASADWRADGRALAFSDGVDLHVLADQSAECATIAGARTAGSRYSPDGDRLIWMAGSAGGVSTDLWQADGQGQAPRPILSGPELSVDEFLDSHRILADRTSPDGYGLIWLDLDEAPPSEHVLVEQVFGSRWPLGSRFFVTGSSFNDQDGTGEVSLVDLEQSTAETIAEGAADYAVGWPPAQGATTFPFAYLEIGRFASDRDGIWVGWIPGARVEGP